MENCKNCKNCKNWLEDKLCYENFGSCLCDKFAYEEKIDRKDENNYHLLYSDYDGYMATLRVHKDFGCIDFEEKER